jgi:hypothetical protein
MPWFLSIAEWDKQCLVSRAAAAGQRRLHYRSVPEHRLDANGDTRDPVTDYRVAPQAELAALVAHKLIGDQPQLADPTGLDSVVGLGILDGPPAVELPAHSLCHRELGQQAVVPPQPGDLTAVGADHLYLKADAGQSARGEPGVHLGREGLGGEHGLLGLLGRRVELHLY